MDAQLCSTRPDTPHPAAVFTVTSEMTGVRLGMQAPHRAKSQGGVRGRAPGQADRRQEWLREMGYSLLPGAGSCSYKAHPVSYGDAGSYSYMYHRHRKAMSTVCRHTAQFMCTQLLPERQSGPQAHETGQAAPAYSTTWLSCGATSQYVCSLARTVYNTSPTRGLVTMCCSTSVRALTALSL